MDCKVGNTVHVRMKVVKDGWNLSVDAAVDGQIVTVPKTAIVHVEPRRPIAVGDTVRHTGASENVFGLPAVEPHLARMHVNAIVDGRAWCRSSGYDYIIEVEKLERVS